MTRKKVKLEWIVNDSARKASLKRRRASLLKKMSELATLCGVSAFVIIYSSNDNEPTIWPSRPMVQQLLERFQGLPEIERSKKLINQETYHKERVAKVNEQLKKLHKKNKEVEADRLMHQIQNGKTLDEFSINELQSLDWLMQEKRKEMRNRIDYFQYFALPLRSSPPQDPALGDDMRRIGNICGDDNTITNVFFDQWFTDIANNSENVASSSSVRSNIGLPYNTYVGSSNITNDMGHHGSVFSDQGGSHMGLSLGNFRGQGESDIGMQSHGNIRDDNSANDIGQGLQSHETGSDIELLFDSIGGSEMGLPFGVFGGSNVGSDIELPFDMTKTNWPHNFSP